MKMIIFIMIITIY